MGFPIVDNYRRRWLRPRKAALTRRTDQLAKDLYYVPLPEGVKQIVRKEWGKIVASGQPVY